MKVYSYYTQWQNETTRNTGLESRERCAVFLALHHLLPSIYLHFLCLCIHIRHKEAMRFVNVGKYVQLKGHKHLLRPCGWNAIYVSWAGTNFTRDAYISLEFHAFVRWSQTEPHYACSNVSVSALEGCCIQTRLFFQLVLVCLYVLHASSILLFQAHFKNSLPIFLKNAIRYQK